MSIYNQSTSLSSGGVMPSVNYNAAIRMPTQPMPDLPDVNSSFNIDLRPIGEAMIAKEEFEYKKEEAEADRQARKAEAEQAFVRQYVLQQMEIDAANKRAEDRNKIDWFNARTNRMKVEKEDEKDNRAALLRVATNWLNNKAMERDADMKAGPMTPADISLADKTVNEEFQNIFGPMGVNITEVLPETRKLYSGFMGSIGATEQAHTESLKETIKAAETKDNAQVSKIAAMTAQSFEASKKAYQDTKIKIMELEEVSAKLGNPNLTQSDREALQTRKTELVSQLGGEKATEALLIDIKKPTYETIQKAKENFIGLVMKAGGTQQEAEVLWSIQDNIKGWSQAAENLSQLDSKVLADNENAIKTLVVKNKTKLLQNDKALGVYMALHEINPALATSFLDETNAEEMYSMLGTQYATTVTDKGNGYYVVSSGGKEIELTPDQAKAIKDNTGLDVASGWMQLHSRTMMKNINKGTAKDMSGIAPYVTPTNDSENEALTTTENLANISRSTDPKALMEYQKKNPNDRMANAAVATNKILSHFDSTKKADDPYDSTTKLYTELTGRVHQLRVLKFISDRIKGGTIEIRTDEKGNVRLWRRAEGLVGGLGTYEGFKNMYAIEDTLNSIPDLTAKEKVAFLETTLGPGNFYTYPDKQMPTLKEYLGRFVDLLQGFVVSPIDLGAALDTKTAEGLSILNKFTDVESVDDVKRIALDIMKASTNKKSVRNSSANAEMVSERTVNSLAEMEQAINEDSKLKKKPAEPEGDITNPVQIPTGVVKKKKIEPIEASAPDYDSGVIAVTND